MCNTICTVLLSMILTASVVYAVILCSLKRIEYIEYTYVLGTKRNTPPPPQHNLTSSTYFLIQGAILYFTEPEMVFIYL